MKKCKLVIKDEVNCQFVGLDVVERRLLSNKFKYEIPYARHLPSVRLGRWDGCIAFFQTSGSTYINLLYEILPILDQRGWDVELEDLRQSKLNFEFEPVDENSFQHITWPEGHPVAGQPIILRDYQQNIVNEFLANPQSLSEVATSAGKTIITAALSYKVEPYGRSIIIVPNKSLVLQTHADYVNMRLDVGVYFGDKKEYDRKHTICTWQSLGNLLKKTKDQTADVTIDEFLKDVVCVIVDESHSVKADILKSLLTGAMANIPIRWGLTGTIPKEMFNFQSLHVAIGKVINRVSANSLQEQGYLANCHVNILQTQETQEYKNYQNEMSFLVTDSDRLDWLAKEIIQIKSTGNTLVLVDRIKTGQELAARIENSVFISGSTKTKDRKEEFDDVAVSEDKVLISTFGVAAVGINIIRLHNLVLLESGKSFVRVIQSIGRGLRKGFDKDFVNIWDITSRCKFSNRHLSKRKTFYKDAKYDYTIKKVDYRV